MVKAILEMSAPKTCADCPLYQKRTFREDICIVTGYATHLSNFYHGTRPESCPLVVIDRDTTLHFFVDAEEGFYGD